MTFTKGADVLMEAFDILAQHNVRVQPLLCGRCEPNHPDSILQSDLDTWCQTHGGVWREHIADIGEVWQNADMFILPSRGGEGMPKSMLEAAASQRPLIVSNVPGCRDFVRHGVEGLLVPPDDPEALAQAIARLAADSGLRQRLGEAARLRLLHGYTEAHVTQTLRESYASFFVSRR
jgi:glycosyltransferase involved in cell wall biosynthesis